MDNFKVVTYPHEIANLNYDLWGFDGKLYYVDEASTYELLDAFEELNEVELDGKALEFFINSAQEMYSM